MSTATDAQWADWRHVGCGVESLHHVLTLAGVEISLDEVLREALAEDGYDEAVGWRHRSLVATSERHGVPGRLASHLDVATLLGSPQTLWLASVNAPEQFECTHLVAVDTRNGALDVFWPQVHPQFGERFRADPDWFGPKMTGRGMAFGREARQPE